MGTFERIRQLSPYLFGTFAVLLIAYFVYSSGGEDIVRSRNNPQSAVIAVVNGQEILRTEFEEKVRVAVENERLRQQQQGKEAEVNDKQVRNQVWNNIIEETLIAQFANNAGIQVTDEEIRDVLIDNPPPDLRRAFSDSTGKFMRSIYLDIVTNPENYPKYMFQDPSQVPQEEIRKMVQQWRDQLFSIEENLRRSLMVQRLINLVGSAESVISPDFAREKYIAENSNAEVEYAFYLKKIISDAEVKVSDDEIKKYYDSHKTLYKQNPARTIKYVSFPIQPSIDDTNRAGKRVDRIANELNKSTDLVVRDSLFDYVLDQFGGETHDYTLAKDIAPQIMSILMSLQDRQVVGPIKMHDGVRFVRIDGRRQGENEVVKASHVLINFNNNKDSALAVAKDILKRAKSGEDFAALARENSQDKGSGARGGDLGYFERGRMVKPFEDAAFGANAGDIVGPVESQFGFHIIKVEDKKSDEIAYSEIVISPRISNVTRNILKRDAFSFFKQVQEGSVSFDTLAARQGLRVTPVALFEEDRSVLGSRYLTAKAFQSELGDVIEPLEMDYYGFVVPQVSEIRKEGVKPLEDVKEDIRKKLVDKKKLDMLKPMAENLFSKLSGAQTLVGALEMDPKVDYKTTSDLKNNGVVPGIGTDFAFSAEAFKAPLNKVSGPVRGENGYYLMIVKSRSVPSEQDVTSALPDYIKQLKNSSMQSAFYNWFSAAKKDAEIVDNRSQFYIEY